MSKVVLDRRFFSGHCHNLFRMTYSVETKTKLRSWVGCKLVLLWNIQKLGTGHWWESQA